VWDLNRQIEEQKDKNSTLKARNDTLDAEVRDLKQGFAAIEERARSELGMIKQDEVFYQVIEQSGISEPAKKTIPGTTPTSPASLPPTPKPKPNTNSEVTSED